MVRDLAWSLTSPHLVSDDEASHDVAVFTDEDAAALLEDAHPWLVSLDHDPGHLVRWVGAQRGTNKLGFYFGALVEYAVRFCPSVGALAVTTQRQVAGAHGTGRMVGQLKLVMLRKRMMRRVTSPICDDSDLDGVQHEVAHWEYNVKYFIDAGAVVSPARRWHAAESCGSGTRTMDSSADDKSIAAAAPAPCGDSCYVGPFLHENMRVRVHEAKRKLALARHPRVSEWLTLWSTGRLEEEEPRDGSGDVLGFDLSAASDAPPPQVSSQLLRGYLLYPLRGDARVPGRTWCDVDPRGSASANHLRGWWTTDADELRNVPSLPHPPRTSHPGGRDSSMTPPDDVMWAVLTRKCHWLGPGIATRRHRSEIESDDFPPILEGSACEYAIRGVPELGIKDVEVHTTRVAIAVVNAVINASGRGVLVCEMIRHVDDDDSADVTWRERSRGFVLPKRWDPWTTVLRSDPFRRRYERGRAVLAAVGTGFESTRDYGDLGADTNVIAVNGPINGSINALDTDNHPDAIKPSVEPDGVFEVMYPERLDIDDMGDDVRVRDKASARFGKLSAEARARRMRGEEGAKRADAGERLTAAVSHHLGTDHAPDALLRELMEVIREEKGVARPVRPHLVRALAAVGGHSRDESGDESDGDCDKKQDGRRRARRDAAAARALVAAAVVGGEMCLSSLNVVDVGASSGERVVATVRVDPSDDDGVKGKNSDEDEGVPMTHGGVVSTYTMSERRGMAHALLDALGPAARRNGCVGAEFAPHARRVFDLCLGKDGGLDNKRSGVEWRRTGVCPRVAVRFASILRLHTPDVRHSVIDAGDATKLAESLASAVQAHRDKASNPPSEDDCDETITHADDDEDEKDTPAARSGAVVELLCWCGEGTGLSATAADVLMRACVESGAAGAAAQLARDNKELRRPLACAHAEVGNHKAAKRAAALAFESAGDDVNFNADFTLDFESIGFGVGVVVQSEGDTSSPDERKVSDEEIHGGAVVPLDVLLAPRGRILLVDTPDALNTARVLLERAMARDGPDASSDEATTFDDHVPVVGVDCEWRPGTKDAPVSVLQMAAGASTAHDPRLGASAVLVDCAALLGPDADDGSAAKCVEFIARVFERCVLCGFGVAADVRKLLASYPDRFEKRFSGISVRTVCVRDIAVGMGVDEVKVRGLASMCALCLGGRELDKSRQKSDWGARPLSDAQISYAALDALAPAMILRRLLASRSTAVGSNPIGGDTRGVYLNVGKSCGTWVRTETWERTALARIEGIERKGPRGPKLNPLTTADVAAALEAAGGAARGVRIEDWNDGKDGVDSHPGVTLCKSLGFVAESPRGAKKVLAVCVLPATGGVVVDARAVTSLLFGSEVNANAASCRLATPGELVDEFGYERGCMGPLGLRRGVDSFTVVFDSSLTSEGGDTTVAVGAGAAGVKATGSVSALVEITGAIVADISSPRRHYYHE